MSNNSNFYNNLSYVSINSSRINELNDKINKEYIHVTNSMFNSISKNYLHDLFYESLSKICFNCKYFDPEKKNIIKFPCKCNFCQNCLEKFINKYTNNLKILNVYELQNFKSISCLCGNPFDYGIASKYSKTINKKHIQNAAKRLKNILKQICCNCGKKNKFDDFVPINFIDIIKHVVCKECFELEFNFDELDDDDEYEYEKFFKKYKLKTLVKKVYCQVCFENHFIDLRDDTKNLKRTNTKTKTKKNNVFYFN